MSLSPTEFKKELIRIGGKNRFNQPNLMLVHTDSARWHDNGPLKYFKCYKEESYLWTDPETGVIHSKRRLVPVLYNRWVIEQWCPPDFLQEWELYRFVYNRLTHEEVDVYGPYNPMGRWHEWFKCQTYEDGYPIPLSRRLLDKIEAMYRGTISRRKHGPNEEPTPEEIQEGVKEYLAEKARMEIEANKGMAELFEELKSQRLMNNRLASHNPRRGLDAHTRRKQPTSNSGIILTDTFIN